jgi:hypothetical protein
MVIDAFAFNLLFLDQDADTNIKGFAVEQFLGLSQVVEQTIKDEGVSHHLYFAQRVDVVKTLNLDVGHTLLLSQSEQPRVTNETVFQFLTVQQEATVLEQWPLVVSVLSIAQTAVGSVAKGAYSVLALSQSVDLKVTRNLTVANTLVMSQSGRGYLPSYFWTSYPITVVEP